MALTPEQQQQQIAQQALSSLATNPGSPGPMLNATRSVAQQSALPPQAMEGNKSGPGWADYLGGVQRVQQAGPGGEGYALPVAPGTKTQRRIEFEESVRQFNEEMAYRRAVAAASAAASARSARMSSAPPQEVNERALIWNHIRGVVDDAVSSGKDWSYVNNYLTSSYGQFPKDMDYEEVQKAAFNYYDQTKYPGEQIGHVQPAPPQEPKLTKPSTWFNWWGKGNPEPAGGVTEDVNRLRKAFYDDKYFDEGF